MRLTADLYRFLKGLSLSADGTVIENQLDSSISYISKYFTPNLKVSQVALKAQSTIRESLSMGYSNGAASGTLLYLLQHSAIDVETPDIFRLCQVAIMDMYSYAYAYEDDNTLLASLTENDINKTIDNCVYLCDYFSGDDRYLDIAKKFSDMIVSLGVIKNNLDSLHKMAGF